MDKKDAGRILFTEGFTQKEIAIILKRSEKTISHWATSGAWKEKKVSFDLMKESNAQRILKMIDYQLRVIERKMEQWENKAKEDGQANTTLIQRGDIDALQKLHTTIKNEAKTWGDYVKVAKELLEYTSRTNIELAKELKPIIDLFLNEKRKVL